MGAPDALEPEDGGEDDIAKKLGVEPEKIDALVRTIGDTARKLGLYMEHANVAVMSPEDADAPPPDPTAPPVLAPILVQTVFTIGDLAFAPERVDPSVGKANDDFREIEAGFVDDEIDDLRKRYGKPQEEEG